MLCTTEKQLKEQLSTGNFAPLYLLFGNEPVLLRTWRQKLIDMFERAGDQLEYMDGKVLDLSVLFDAAQLLSMFGGRRIIVIDNFEAEQLMDADCKALSAFWGEIPEGTVLIVTAVAESFDEKKGKCAKKLLSAAEKSGLAARLDRRGESDLRRFVIARCKSKGQTLSNEVAAFLLAHCGDDMGTLSNECDKLCAYATEIKKDIDDSMIRRVCPGVLSADPFALARLMLRGDLQAVLSQVNTLMQLRQPVIMILANLSGAFCDLARACAARTGGRTASDLTSDFAYRFAWRAQNAYRDCARLNAAAIYSVCELLCEADATLKSSNADERIVLETAIIRAMRALQKGGVAC
ncbi:DNA polymerase III, delta subunit [anaerobic digester metagenome]|jgi:DNA polymerase-3 subunit delta|nr:polymerase subunit delta [Oscillospiraceae bacterium]